MEGPIYQAVIAAITGLIVGIPSYIFGRRGRNASSAKTEAEAIKVLSEVVANLGMQLSNAHAEMPRWKEQIHKVEAEAKQLSEQCDEWETKANAALVEIDRTKRLLTICESREPLGIDKANYLREEAASIIENISHMSFVPTGEPTDDDLSAIRRLKHIRESAKRMQEATNGTH